ncbi:hypothetical protein Krac_0923 [Ktedonobacter racemifer DSM 44963]|uniref:Uncharacterized protein n=1 Tax=Ktedonobacter racemifer DSM 44963 TaxID=485913 RepID=D6U5S1_KTERA|nr:hypothetical protein Krac_0923 [Ktedonobacter racemifer DSM 44963]
MALILVCATKGKIASKRLLHDALVALHLCYPALQGASSRFSVCCQHFLREAQTVASLQGVSRVLAFAAMNVPGTFIIGVSVSKGENCTLRFGYADPYLDKA